MAEKKEKVRESVRVLQGALDHYEEEHPHWRIEVLVSLIKWSIRSLQHCIENARDRKITWEQPFVELRYPIKWDWEVSRTRGEKYGRLLFGKITDRKSADKKTALKTLSGILARLLNARALADLTNQVRFARKGNYQTPYVSPKFDALLRSIKNEASRRDVYEQIVRPFSIGAALVDYGNMAFRHGARVPAKVARQLQKLPSFIDIPHIGLNGDVNGRKIEMSLVFQVHPLITDHTEEKAYHPITVGLFIAPKVSSEGIFFDSPAAWPRRDRQTLWKELVHALDTLADKLIPKKEREDSVILMVNAKLKVPLSQWTPGNRGNEIKRIAEALSLGGELSQIDVRTVEAGNESLGNQCPVCGFTHDSAFTQVLVPGKEPITLAGVLPDIVKCVHVAHEQGLPKLSTKDDGLLRRCGSYGHPSKAFYDLRQSAAYKILFDTSRRGFIALRGFRRKES